MIEAVMAVALSIIVMGSVITLSIWVMKVCDSCKHSYERVDTANDRKMILVCRRCGKIKKLRK